MSYASLVVVWAFKADAEFLVRTVESGSGLWFKVAVVEGEVGK